MPPDNSDPYDPPIPSYDEAVGANASRPALDGGQNTAYPHSPLYDHEADALLTPLTDGRTPTTGTHLLSHRSNNHHQSRRGYRPPTVETDDEDSASSWMSDDDAASMRRELEEMDVLDPEDLRQRGSIRGWGKRIGFSLSLPTWKWRWRLPRMRIRLGEDTGASSSGSRSRSGSGRAAAPSGEGEGQDGSGGRRRWRFRCPKPTSTAAFLIFARIFALLLVVGFFYLLFFSDIFSTMARRMGSAQLRNPEQIRVLVQSNINPSRLDESLKHFSSYAHLAGSEGNYALAYDVDSRFREAGLEDVMVDKYFVYLNYPKGRGGRAVQLLNDKSAAEWSARLEEDPVDFSQKGHATYVFHGYSKSGDVTGPLVYANYGTRDDFKHLHDRGIETKGAIALVRQYGPVGTLGMKVKAAEQAGCIGCIIYNDPADNGIKNGGTAPDGWFMPQDGVPRGSVALTPYVVGDPLTPGWESVRGLPRMKVDEADGLPKIPSMPLSWLDAQHLVKALEGAGEAAPEAWRGGVPEVEWWTGNASSLASAPRVRLQNELEERERQPIWNVYGKITGADEAAKAIIVGAHRDAWAFGAARPGSGTAVMLEVMRILAELSAAGYWRPLRTIQFMSWDGGGYNMAGSTEFVEKNLDGLRADCYAYINLDAAVAGHEFRAAGSPLFHKAVLRALGRVADPASNKTSLKDGWDRRGAGLGALADDSDHVAFRDIAGVASLDLGFAGGRFPEHSVHDNFAWIKAVVDPDMAYHVRLAEVLGLIVLELADLPVLPLDLAAYSRSLGGWADDLRRWGEDRARGGEGKNKGKEEDKKEDKKKLDKEQEAVVGRLKKLRTAAGELEKTVEDFSQWEMRWQSAVIAANGWEPAMLGAERAVYNDALGRFEGNFLDLEMGGGIPNRTQFKHLIYGPPLWADPGASAYYFPAIRDWIDAGNWTEAAKAADKATGMIKKAVKGLLDRQNG